MGVTVIVLRYSRCAQKRGEGGFRASVWCALSGRDWRETAETAETQTQTQTQTQRDKAIFTGAQDSGLRNQDCQASAGKLGRSLQHPQGSAVATKP
jgi:hypothetical protein